MDLKGTAMYRGRMSHMAAPAMVPARDPVFSSLAVPYLWLHPSHLVRAWIKVRRSRLWRDDNELLPNQFRGKKARK
jgi:hypothetical protein